MTRRRTLAQAFLVATDPWPVAVAAIWLGPSLDNTIAASMGKSEDGLLNSQVESPTGSAVTMIHFELTETTAIEGVPLSSATGV